MIPGDYSRSTRNASPVQVVVITRPQGGIARVLVNGTPRSAILPPTYTEGDRFLARPALEGGVLSLTPLPDKPGTEDGRMSLSRESALTALALRLDLSPTPPVLSLLSFYTAARMRIEPDRIRRLSSLIQAFGDRIDEAAEAAALLDAEGPLPDHERIAGLIAYLGGESGGDPGSRRSREEREFALGPAERAETGKSWLILPFRRDVSGGYEGSARFLVEGETRRATLVRVGAVIGGRSIIADTGDGGAVFTVNPPVSSVVLERIAVYYKRALESMGARSGESGDFSGYWPVDVRA